MYLLLKVRCGIDTKAFMARISERGRMECERRVLLMVWEGERRRWVDSGLGGAGSITRCGCCGEVRLLR